MYVFVHLFTCTKIISHLERKSNILKYYREPVYKVVSPSDLRGPEVKAAGKFAVLSNGSCQEVLHCVEKSPVVLRIRVKI